MPTTTVAVHTISFRGTAGAIFVTIVCAAISYVIGFATPNWRASGSSNEGLWESCRCWENNRDQDRFQAAQTMAIIGLVGLVTSLLLMCSTSAQHWFKATQAMAIIGLVGLAIALILICLYMCVHQVSKNSTIIGLVVVCLLTVIFMLIAVVIYGTKMDDLHWSYALVVIGCIFTFVAGILSFVQLRSSGVHI